MKIQICFHFTEIAYKCFLLPQGKNLTILKKNLNKILLACDLEKENKTKITFMITFK